MENNLRDNNKMRDVRVTTNYIKHPEGSVLIEMGDTKVICSATIEEKVPPFLKNSGEGWITAEYSMLPSSTDKRNIRESSKGKLSGRTQEIQRLIGRSLRTAVDLKELGEKTIWIDCDVIQADGGTRTASITGGFIALYLGLKNLRDRGVINNIPIKFFVSAISVGVVDGDKFLDLDYNLDSNADVDMNIVMTDEDEIIEIQGTGEKQTFSIEDLNELVTLAKKGNKELIEIQKNILL